MPIRSPAERKRRRRPGTAGAAKPAKQSKKRRVDDAVVSTSGVVATTAAATITAAPAVPAALAPAPTFTAPTLAPSFATTFLPSFTPSFIPSFTPSFAPAPVPAPPVPKKNVMDISQLLSEDDSSPTSASAPLPVATKTAGLSSALDAIITPPTLPTPSSKSYPTPSDQEDGNLVVFMPYADEPDVPLFEVGVTGFGHRPEQSATWNTSSLDNEMTHVRIFSKVGLMPNPQKPKHQAWRM